MSAGPQSSEAALPLMIIGRSARALTSLAASRFRPYAIDFFADADLQARASGWHKLAWNSRMRFGAALVDAADALTAEHGPMPLVYGAGFEAEPETLAVLEQRLQVLGTPSATLKRLIDMPRVLEALRREYSIATPETVSSCPVDRRGWLSKRSGATGGFHLRHANEREFTGSGRYFQKLLTGVSVSALYLADSNDVQNVGFFKHLQRGPRYGHVGAVTWLNPSQRIRNALQQAGEAVAQHLRPLGLFGLDFVQDSADQLWLIDINLRPTSSLELRDDALALLEQHVAVCSAQSRLYSSQPQRQCAGQIVVFADAACTVGDNVTWPSGARDIPVSGSAIAAGQPLCTLSAAGTSESDVLEKLARHAGLLAQTMYPNSGPSEPVNIAIRTVGGADSCRN